MKKFLLPIIVLLSILIATYGPMTTYSYAQSVASSELQTLKDKVTKELDRRIASYQKNMDNLSVDFSISKDAKGTTPSKGNEKTAIGTTFSYTENGIEGIVQIPPDTQNQVKQYAKKMIEQLKGLKTKVANASSLKDMKDLAKNVDAQYEIDKLTNAQAASTQAIESMTGVLDQLKTTFNNIQGQVSSVQDSSTGDKADMAAQAQAQLTSLSSIVTSISTILISAIGLLIGLLSQFTSLMGGMGSLGSLGNMGNLGSMLGSGSGGLGGLSSLTSAAGGASGLLTSFSAITSQLDIGKFMSGNAFGSLSSLSGLLKF